MAEIHPNDIGLATFADVGDVEKLKTSAKNLVDELNEIYQNGTQGGGSAFGDNGMLTVKTTSYWAKTILSAAITTSSSARTISLSEITSP